MNPHARSAFRRAIYALEMAKCLHEEHAAGGHTELIGAAYAEILRANGELAAALQMLDLAELVTKGRAECRVSPLRIVR